MATIRNSFMLLIISIIIGNSVLAQTSYNNGWIDYSKTYYKFKIGTFGTDFEGAPVKKGVVRIYGATLAANGLAGLRAEQIKLLRNGQEIPIYVTKDVGVLTADDYIEFWGESADGRPDKDLYRDTTYQLSDYWSLATDSASYYITTNVGINRRFTNATNAAASATIQPERNFTYTLGKYYREQFNPGFGASAGAVVVYSSSYEKGEGLTSMSSGGGTSWQAPKLYADSAAGSAYTARFTLAGANLNNRTVDIYVDNTKIASPALNFYATNTFTVPNISPSLVLSDAPFFFFADISADWTDNFVMSKIEMDYKRKFDFGGASNFEFTLPASDTGRLIKISDFSANGVASVLYDLNNGKRYVANTDIDGVQQFLLEPSTLAYSLVLVRGDGSTATNITTVEKRHFIDFTNTANQGNYLIITNPVLYGSGSTNYVEQYKGYRSSAAGGSFNAKIISIEELEDQFAFGIKMHPLAIKNFLRFARNKFAVSPAFAFIIGKGIEYNLYRLRETNPVVQQTALVPTFGSPGSDNLLSSDNYDPVPATPIGRLSAISPAEVGVYLAKVKQYEQAQQSTDQSVANKGWMKNILQVTGVSDPSVGAELDGYMSYYKTLITDSAFGGRVTTFSKSAHPGDYPQQVSNFTSMFNKGSAIVNYFGHSSATALDFSLDNPANLNNTGRYPIFIVNGCLAGNIFNYSAGRLNTLQTISEKFVLLPQKGAIGYLSTTSFGIVGYLDTYTKEFYKAISLRQYGKGFGVIMQDAIASGLNIIGASDFYGRAHAEQFAFHGDPALTVNSFAKPDYGLQLADVTVSPSFISVADDSFAVKVIITNLGRATNDSVHFSIFRKLPDGDSVSVYTKEFASIKIADSITTKIAIVPNRDNAGTNLVAHIDDNNRVDELSETNNILAIPVNISTADIRPVYPYNYAIVNTAAVVLAASTANPLDTVKKYTIQVDTTALFNSAGLIQSTITSSGGVIQKNISLSLDNTVYYWRVKAATSNRWNNFSFIHRSAGNAGGEQGHFYQHTQSAFSKVQPDSAARSLSFTNSLVNLFIRQAIYGHSGSGEDADFSVAVDGTYLAESACVGNSIIFNVFNPQTFKIYANTTNPNGAAASCKPLTSNNFEFWLGDAPNRNNAVQFLNQFVHDGDYVVCRSIDVPPFASDWASDTLVYGAGNSLYNVLKAQGVNVDSFYFPRCFIYIFKKNDAAHFTPVTVYSDGLYDATDASVNIFVNDTAGYVTSPKFGPGKAWNKVAWKGYDEDNNNTAKLNVIGVDKNNQETVLYTLGKGQQTQDISSISAAAYPYVKLQMYTQDSITFRPYQLTDWSVEYTPVAEGAVAPNIGASLPDSINYPHMENTLPDTLTGYVVFKNVSNLNFGALKTKLVLYDSAGIAHTYPVNNTKPLVAGDTANVWFNLNVTDLPAGKYSFNLMVNPDNDQPEQVLFNNLVYKYITISRKLVEPVHLLTFTGQPQGKFVLLNWSATNEVNFSHYEVEHSADGRSFTKIGTVQAQNGPGTGLGGGVNNYSLLHTSPVTGQNYYRLKIVDKDGKYAYSIVIIVDFAATGEVKVFPNPFTTALNITVSGTANTKNVVKVLDVSGKVVLQQTFNGGGILLDVSNLAAGNYVVQVNNSTKPQTFKVQKQNK